MIDLDTLQIRRMQEGDAPLVAIAFADMNKTRKQYERYWQENVEGTRITIVALMDGSVVGYTNVIWKPDYQPFRERNIPEIQDLNVVPASRRKCVATRLMDQAERIVAERSSIIGIGVGLHPGYAAAQRMYVLRGYIPDAMPLTCNNAFVSEGQAVTLDDELVLHLTKNLDKELANQVPEIRLARSPILSTDVGPERKRMAKHIGIVACSAEGAALCYRTLCAEAPACMGEHLHPEVSMHTHALGKYMVHIRSGDWGAVAGLMLSSARKLADIGAELVICPDNTIHQAFALVAAHSPIPWLHIAEAVGAEARARGLRTLGILGTKYLMTGPVYPDQLRKVGIACEMPEEADRERIDAIIFKELVNGVRKEESRLFFNRVIQKLKDRGCDGVVLGCTEIPLLVDAHDCPLPALDSTRLLARAALRESLAEGQPAPALYPRQWAGK